MRNVLIHNYFGIDLDVVWSVVADDLPGLKRYIESLLQTYYTKDKKFISLQRLSDVTKERQSGVDWFKIAGFPNVLVHDYLGIDIERVQNILEKELPTLKKAIQQLLE